MEILQFGELRSPVVRDIPPLPKSSDKNSAKKPADKEATGPLGGTSPSPTLA
jgi:hypothetical protein